MQMRSYSALSALVLITMISRAQCLAHGYSFAKFMGPVSGAEQKVLVDGGNGQHKQHDYIAQPDYHFEYGVQDPKTMVHQTRQETRHGDVVQDPDGKLRTVKYTADKKHGFHASISNDGHVVNYPQDPVRPDYQHQTPGAPQLPHIGGGSGGGDGGGGKEEEDSSSEGDEEESGEGDEVYEAEGDEGEGGESDGGQYTKGASESNSNGSEGGDDEEEEEEEEEEDDDEYY